ncbi:MAG: hypothetical protein HY070_09515 [Chloroflexi bacterium]|nr:hypothetical protein [Chloroflexota bacterium]
MSFENLIVIIFIFAVQLFPRVVGRIFSQDDEKLFSVQYVKVEIKDDRVVVRPAFSWIYALLAPIVICCCASLFLALYLSKPEGFAVLIVFVITNIMVPIIYVPAAIKVASPVTFVFDKTKSMLEIITNVGTRKVPFTQIKEIVIVNSPLNLLFQITFLGRVFQFSKIVIMLVDGSEIEVVSVWLSNEYRDAQKAVALLRETTNLEPRLNVS